MFFYKNLQSFRIQEYIFRFPNKAIGQHFMFLEDANDIVNVQGMPYQHQAETMNNNMSVVLRITPFVQILDHILFVELKNCLKFKTMLRFQQNHSPEKDIFLGYADILAMPFTFTSSTITLHPTFQYHDKIWVKDLPYTGSKTFFLESFDAKLWLTFIGIFTLCLLLSLGISKIIRNFKNSRIETFNVVSLLMDQGVEHVSSIWSHKILIFSLAVLLIIFFGGFGAFLSSLLAIKKIALPFDDLTSVFTQNEYTLCLQHRTVIYAWTAIEKRRNKHFIANVNTEDCPVQYRIMFDGAFKNVEHIDCEFGKVVFITSGSGLDFRKFSKRCNILPLPGKYLRQDTSFLLNPGFKHRKAFNRMLVLFRTTGLIRHEFLRIQNIADIMEPSTNFDEQELQSITFYQTHLILVMFCVGAALSLIILAIEMLYKRAQFNGLP